MDEARRYSLIEDGARPEEIVLLIGRGCFWKQCRFCDYYTDAADAREALKINRRALSKITGKTGRLTALNSGSWFELDPVIRDEIIARCRALGIQDLTVEAHWAYHRRVQALRDALAALGVRLHARIGIETFDVDFRENVLKKGMGDVPPVAIADVFDECCLLFGLAGKSLETLRRDLDTALRLFKDVYLNLYAPRPGCPADPELIRDFYRELYPEIDGTPGLHILLNNTDLGVGET